MYKSTVLHLKNLLKTHWNLFHEDEQHHSDTIFDRAGLTPIDLPCVCSTVNAQGSVHWKDNPPVSSSVITGHE